MSLHCFTIPALAPEPAQSALNAFCTQHRVLRIDRQLVADGVPLYAVFTNQQLASIAERRCTSLAELAAIEGIGAARIDRYGAAVLQQLANPPVADDLSPGNNPAPSVAADDPPLR